MNTLLPSKGYVNGLKPRFIVLCHGLRCYCIILWPKLGISGKLTLVYTSFRRPGFENHSKKGGGV